MNTSLLLVPRYPISIHYHVTTPDEVTPSYNSIYAPGGAAPYWDHVPELRRIPGQGQRSGREHISEGGAWPTTCTRPTWTSTPPARAWPATGSRPWHSRNTAATAPCPLNTYNWDQLGDYVKSRTLEEKAKAAGTLGAVWDRKTNVVSIGSRRPSR